MPTVSTHYRKTYYTQINNSTHKFTTTIDPRDCGPINCKKPNQTYFQIKETASQSDKADRRYTGLKLVVLNKN